MTAKRLTKEEINKLLKAGADRMIKQCEEDLSAWAKENHGKIFDHKTGTFV